MNLDPSFPTRLRFGASVARWFFAIPCRCVEVRGLQLRVMSALAGIAMLKHHQEK
jgi:hypothetical protein